MREITRFAKEYRFLSNFHPCVISYEEEIYPTAEHLYQALKFPEGSALREKIRLAGTPNEAKKLGQSKGIRKDWNELKVDVMHFVLRLKFAKVELKERLLATEDALLIEGNWWGDTFWGCVQTNGKWTGYNWLGKLLMELREEIKKTEGATKP